MLDILTQNFLTSWLFAPVIVCHIAAANARSGDGRLSQMRRRSSSGDRAPIGTSVSYTTASYALGVHSNPRFLLMHLALASALTARAAAVARHV